MRVGDRVKDINVTWPRYNQAGTVVSVKNNSITWRSDKDNQLITDHIKDMKKISNITDNFKDINRGVNRLGRKVIKTLKQTKYNYSKKNELKSFSSRPNNKRGK